MRKSIGRSSNYVDEWVNSCSEVNNRQILSIRSVNIFKLAIQPICDFVNVNINQTPVTIASIRNWTKQRNIGENKQHETNLSYSILSVRNFVSEYGIFIHNFSSIGRGNVSWFQELNNNNLVLYNKQTNQKKTNQNYINTKIKFKFKASVQL